MPYENPGDIPGVVAAEAAGDEAQVGSHDDLYKTDAALEEGKSASPKLPGTKLNEPSILDLCGAPFDWVLFWKFILPFFFFWICSTCCSMLGHYGTWRFLQEALVHGNLKYPDDGSYDPATLIYPKPLDEWFSFLFDSAFTSPESGIRLVDWLVWVPGFFFFTVSILYLDTYVWIKFWVIAGILLFGKGICTVITSLPDASGRQNCYVRLTNPVVNPNGYDEIMQLDYTNDAAGAIGTTLGFAMRSITTLMGLLGKGTVLYCADMMYSGHTLSCMVGSIASICLVARHDFNLPEKCLPWLKKLLYFIFAMFPVFESIVIVASRFHYSADVYVSILLVLLAWSSEPITRLLQYLADYKTKN